MFQYQSISTKHYMCLMALLITAAHITMPTHNHHYTSTATKTYLMSSWTRQICQCHLKVMGIKDNVMVNGMCEPLLQTLKHVV